MENSNIITINPEDYKNTRYKNYIRGRMICKKLAKLNKLENLAKAKMTAQPSGATFFVSFGYDIPESEMQILKAALELSGLKKVRLAVQSVEFKF